MKKVLLPALLLSAAFSCMAANAPADADRVKALVKSRMNIEASSVRKIPAGLYEVVVNRQVVYVDKDVKFFFGGHIFDIVSQKDLTQARLDELSKIDIKELPLDQAIKTVKGKGERVLYVFSDPYCSYCRRLEHTLEKMDNITLYTFVTPLLNSDEMVNRIMCEKDPAKAWHEWMFEQKEPKSKGDCKTDIGKKNFDLTMRFGIDGAPCIYFKDGSRIEGAASLEEIEERLKSIK